MPVDAYVSPRGFKETDHANQKEKEKINKKTMIETKKPTGFRVGALDRIAFKIGDYLPIFEVP